MATSRTSRCSKRTTRTSTTTVTSTATTRSRTCSRAPRAIRSRASSATCTARSRASCASRWRSGTTTASAGTGVSATVISELKSAGIKVGEYPSQHGTNIHSKYLLIDSDYDTSDGRSHRQLVWTGSHNYTKGALRENDEVLLRVDNPTIFADFLANWNTIHDQIGVK